MPPVSKISTILAEALRLLAAGLSVIPIATDGSKAPEWSVLPKEWSEAEQKQKPVWNPFQRERMTEAEAQQMFRGNVGIAIIGGTISGNLETLDFDEEGLFEHYEQLAEDNGVGDLIKRLPLVATPSGGVHLRYRCTEVIAGNQKLAQRRDEVDGKTKPKTRIETRGEGGYALAPGSPASCHELNRPYTLLRGNLADIPVLTPSEVKTLHRLARVFNEYDEPEKAVSVPQVKRLGPNTTGLRPGDAYNEQGLADAVERLQAAGWKAKNHGDGYYLTRPGKNKGVSATLNIVPGKLHVFSSNAHPFDNDKNYSLFAVYTTLAHNGDYREAARELIKQGYGTPFNKSAFCSGAATNQPVEASPEATPAWIVDLLGNIGAQVIDGRVYVGKEVSAKDIIGGIKRLWRNRNTHTVQTNYAIGVLAASLDGRQGQKFDELIQTYFGDKEYAGQIRTCKWVASQWSPSMIAEAIEKGFGWSKIVDASAKCFTVADRQKFIQEGATLQAIREEKKKRKGETGKYKSNSQLLKAIEEKIGIDEVRKKLLALYEEISGSCSGIEYPDSYSATGQDSDFDVSDDEGGYVFDTEDEEPEVTQQKADISLDDALKPFSVLLDNLPNLPEEVETPIVVPGYPIKITHPVRAVQSALTDIRKAGNVRGLERQIATLTAASAWYAVRGQQGGIT